MTWLKLLWVGIPLPWKLIAGAAVIGAICLGIRWWANSQYYKGVEQGRVLATTEIQKAKEKEWAIEEDKLAEQAKAIAATRQTVEIEKAELTRARQTLHDSLNIGLAEIRASQGASDAVVNAVPDAALVDAVRTLSRELARPAPAK